MLATCMKTALSFSDSALLIFSTPHYNGYVQLVKLTTRITVEPVNQDT